MFNLNIFKPKENPKEPKEEREKIQERERRINELADLMNPFNTAEKERKDTLENTNNLSHKIETAHFASAVEDQGSLNKLKRVGRPKGSYDQTSLTQNRGFDTIRIHRSTADILRGMSKAKGETINQTIVNLIKH